MGGRQRDGWIERDRATINTGTVHEAKGHRTGCPPIRDTAGSRTSAGEEIGPSGTPSWTAVSVPGSNSSSESDHVSSSVGGGIEENEDGRNAVEGAKSVTVHQGGEKKARGQKSMNGII